VRTIELLRKYCMNDNPVHFQVVSDQAANFSRCACPCVSSPPSLTARPPASNSRVNYEDENYNVGLPVFIIHGASACEEPASVS
jgi:double-strand break repair protein MRE11